MAPWRAKTDDMSLVVYQPMKNKCSFSPLGVRHISRVTGICLSQINQVSDQSSDFMTRIDGMDVRI